MTTQPDTRPATLRDTKRGEYIKRKPDAKTVYIRGAYDAATKRISLIDTEDMNRELFLKPSAVVYVGFTY